jgi:hypothetical protein
MSQNWVHHFPASKNSEEATGQIPTIYLIKKEAETTPIPDFERIEQ